jgi:hypothetical protein
MGLGFGICFEYARAKAALWHLFIRSLDPETRRNPGLGRGGRNHFARNHTARIAFFLSLDFAILISGCIRISNRSHFMHYKALPVENQYVRENQLPESLSLINVQGQIEGI